MEVEYGKPQWRSGYPSKITAAAAHARLEEIKKCCGGCLIAQDIVDAAKDPLDPLHAGFDWDVDAAANEHWKGQARNMVRSLVYFREKAPKDPVNFFVSITAPTVEEPHRTAYRDLEGVLADPVTRGELLKRALGELARCRREYKQLRELASVFAEIDKVVKKHSEDKDTKPPPV